MTIADVLIASSCILTMTENTYVYDMEMSNNKNFILLNGILFIVLGTIVL
jgi:hypothetical protein